MSESLITMVIKKLNISFYSISLSFLYYKLFKIFGSNCDTYVVISFCVEFWMKMRSCTNSSLTTRFFCNTKVEIGWLINRIKLTLILTLTISHRTAQPILMEIFHMISSVSKPTVTFILYLSQSECSKMVWSVGR